MFWLFPSISFFLMNQIVSPNFIEHESTLWWRFSQTFFLFLLFVLFFSCRLIQSWNAFFIYVVLFIKQHQHYQISGISPFFQMAFPNIHFTLHFFLLNLLVWSLYSKLILLLLFFLKKSYFFILSYALKFVFSFNILYDNFTK